MKRKILALLLTITLTVGLFTACGQQGSPSTGSSADTSTPVSVGTETSGQTTEGDQTQAVSDNKETAYPLTLNDANGTPVTIKAKPVKIVSLPLGICEMLMSMVEKNEIAAMTHYVDDPVVSNIADAAKGVGKRLDFNAEIIIALQPDLVLVDTWQDANIVKQLRDANINVFVTKTMTNVDQQKEMLRLLGNITNNAAKAEDIVNWMEQKLKAVSDKLAGLKEDQKLTIIDYSEMGSTSGKDTNFDDVVTRAGLINPVSKEGLAGWPELSKEMIVKYNPDIICLPSWYYDGKISLDSLSKSIREDKSLAGVKAVKNNRLITIPYNHMTTTSQYSVLGIEDMAKAAYPDLFK